MDSKYSIGNKNSSISYSSGLKRKFSYSSSSSNVPTKRPNLHSTPKPSIATTPKNVSSTTSNPNERPMPKDIQQQRKQLPVYAVKDSLMKHLQKHLTLIIIGETGSGKTTQIPQFLYRLGFGDKGMIAVTQPRRVAAITISKRVSQEMKCNLGDEVGYTVRFEDTTSKRTKIRFMTDGSLLREALSDKLLLKYSVILLDEAHERTINTDVLFGIVKEAQKARKLQNKEPLKIIIMSATMDVDHFSKYFNCCKTVYLEGRTYPIKLMHAKESQPDYAHACLSTLFKIHQTAPANHDILVFLTGQEEIETMSQQIRSITKSNSLKGPTLRVCPLYAQLSQQRQMMAFQPIGGNARKVVLCTNIAETSLTLSGIKYVIDSGVVKRRVYDPVTGMDSLKVIRISQDQAMQRSGRAGRESDGFCYRAYTADEYKKMPVSSTPEILRSNLSATILQLLAIGINIKHFDFIDRPRTEAIDSAIKQLHLLGALTSEKTAELTEDGRKMAKFPLDPKYSRMILNAPRFNCLEEMLSIIAVLSGEEIFINNIHDTDRRGDALTAHAKFENQYGDHLKLLNVFKAYSKSERVKTWCHDNFLNNRNLLYAADVRKQLKEICTRLRLEFSSCGNNFDQVRKCLLSGLFVNVAELQRDSHYITISNRQRAKIHPSSMLSGRPKAKLIVFTELVTTNRNYLRTVTQIEPDWIDEIVPNINLTKKLFQN